MRKMISVVLKLATSSGMDGDDPALMEREHQADFDEQQELRQQQEDEARGGAGGGSC